MDVIKTLTGLIKDVDNNDIDSLKDLYLELIYLRSELQAINYTRCCEEFFCEDEDLEYSSKKCKEQCDGCKWIENL
jgi:hypothetical protein